MLGFRELSDYARAVDVLRSVDYTAASVGRVLGRESILTMPSSDVPRVLRRTRELTPLDTLVRLLFVGLPVPVAAVQAALAPMSLDVWIEAHLLQAPDNAGLVEPLVQIWPLEGLLLAVDLPWRKPTAPQADFVVPPGPLTLELAHVMIRRPCARLLDLGTGSGMLALAAANCAETVVATDKNERAIEFAQVNARLNQCLNIDCRAGDLFEPVAGERFQSVLCNPPFVISPSARYLFRDSGQRGDEFCRRLLRAAVEHLEEGGFYQFTANVPHQVGRSWKTDLAAWFEGLGCDVLVLVTRSEDASDYAMNWILGTETKDAALAGQRYEAWMNYFEQAGIEAVSYLHAAVRRRSGGPNWLQLEEPPCQIVGPCGDELLRFFEARDAFGDDAQADHLLNRRLRLASDIRLEQELSMTDDGMEVSHIRLRKTGGLQYPLTVHEHVARLLFGCQGTRTLRELSNELSGELGVSPERLISVMLPVVRSLLERSVLFPWES